MNCVDAGFEDFFENASLERECPEELAERFAGGCIKNGSGFIELKKRWWHGRDQRDGVVLFGLFDQRVDVERGDDCAGRVVNENVSHACRHFFEAGRQLLTPAWAGSRGL